MLWKETALVRALGLTQIPMILFVGPRVLELDEKGSALEIPLSYRTKNHQGSMYIGVLTTGADVAAGIVALDFVRKHHPRVVPVFKDMHADYLKRCDGDTIFRCSDGPAIRDAVKRADETGERISLPVTIVATVPSKYGDEPCARFTMALSLKRKSGV